MTAPSTVDRERTHSTVITRSLKDFVNAPVAGRENRENSIFPLMTETEVV